MSNFHELLGKQDTMHELDEVYTEIRKRKERICVDIYKKEETRSKFASVCGKTADEIMKKIGYYGIDNPVHLLYLSKELTLAENTNKHYTQDSIAKSHGPKIGERIYYNP